MVKLINITEDSSPTKKWVAKFMLDNGKIKLVRFGAKGYTDYTLGATDEQRESYWKRHKKDFTGDPTTPGALSLFILWTDKSMKKSIWDYKEKFNL